MAGRSLAWDCDRIYAFLRDEFPQADAWPPSLEIAALEAGHVRVVRKIDDSHLRPGGTVSGPAMMSLVDLAVYVLLLAHHGEAARLSVTTGMQIDFLSKPERSDLICDAGFLKHGRTLSVASCKLYSAGSERLVAQAQATYFMNGAFG